MKRILFAVGFLFPCVSYAQWVGIDRKTIQQVTTSTASAVAKEEIINSNMAKHEEYQKKASASMAAITFSKEMYRFTLKNVDAFGKDNDNIVEIVRLAKMISIELVETTKELMKNPKSSISSWNRIQGLTSEAVGSLQYIYSLVSDGKVALNIPGLPAISKDKDGENLLDPLTRLKVCDDAIVNLRRIYNILVQMKYQCMYTTTWAQVLNEKLPLETFFVIDSKNIVDGIINDFNKLK